MAWLEGLFKKMVEQGVSDLHLKKFQTAGVSFNPPALSEHPAP